MPWQPQPAAAALIDQLIWTKFFEWTRVASLAEDLRTRTGTRLLDWVDHLRLHDQPGLTQELTAAGFTSSANGTIDAKIWRHAGGLFPTVLTSARDEAVLALRVESIEAFVAANSWCIAADASGEPMAEYRERAVAVEESGLLLVVERHGNRGFASLNPPPDKVAACERIRECFAERPRDQSDLESAFEGLRAALATSIDAIGAARTVDLFFAEERAFWMGRNRAAQVQKSRQDRLGLGWANHDHHTYRSSRAAFHHLIAIWEQIGFHCREPFYAGAEAGWGAQVMEHPDCGIVIFADVDLTTDEVDGDFAHTPLAPCDAVGTIGLWCQLHGESVFAAGMHHLECQFDFEGGPRTACGGWRRHDDPLHRSSPPQAGIHGRGDLARRGIKNPCRA